MSQDASLKEARRSARGAAGIDARAILWLDAPVVYSLAGLIDERLAQAGSI
jgi:hypothetical protein